MNIGHLTALLRQIGEPETTTNFLLGLHAEMEMAAQEVVDLKKLMVGDAGKEYAKLGEEELAASKHTSELDEQFAPLSIQVSVLKERLSALKNTAIKASEIAGAIRERLAYAKTAPLFDHEFHSSQWDVMLRWKERKYSTMRLHCESKRNSSSLAARSSISAGMRALSEFAIRHRETLPQDIESDWRIARTWIHELIDRLEKTELRKQEEAMEAAYQASQETFRQDVAIALNSHFDWLNLTMERLNKALDTCPVFSNGERYRFQRILRSDLEPLYKFITHVATHGHTNDLITEIGEMPPQFRQLLENKVALGAASERSPLDDYREFFTFDIEILREDPETHARKVVGHLSKRLGPGSGGEHRAPLYVIAGAALASAYRGDPKRQDGMRFIMLDEAFNKMDLTNIIATMRYLDGLGFQILLSSPGENQPILMAFLDRYYDILRDVDRNVVSLEGHTVSERTRQLARTGLIEFEPELVAEELSKIRGGIPALEGMS